MQLILLNCRVKSVTPYIIIGYQIFIKLKYLIVLLLLPLFGKTQVPIFKYNKDKIVFIDSVLTDKPFSLFVKTKLNEYAKSLNTHMKYEANKMKDYIVYEDSSVIVANVKFFVKQTLLWTISSGIITIKKSNQIFYIELTDIKIDKSANVISGEGTNGSTLEAIDWKNHDFNIPETIYA